MKQAKILREITVDVVPRVTNFGLLAVGPTGAKVWGQNVASPTGEIFSNKENVRLPFDTIHKTQTHDLRQSGRPHTT